MLGAVSGHPHIVSVFDAGVCGQSRPYLVMEYLPGGTLAQRLRRHGRLPWPEATEIGVKLAGALASAHASGILHRDVKPENVLVSAFGEPQLVDFGLAGLRGDDEAGSGLVTASPAHAAPEVLAGEPAGLSSDVYSLGSTVFALLTGHAPFEGPGDGRPAGSAPGPEPDLRAAGVPAPVEEAVMDALARDPATRTSSARALGGALQAAQRAAGLEATRLVVPTAAGPAVAPPAADDGSPTVRRMAERRAPSAAPTLSVAGARGSRLVIAGAAVAAVVLIAVAAVAIPRAGGGPSPVPSPVATSTTAPPTPVIPPAPAPAPDEQVPTTVPPIVIPDQIVRVVLPEPPDTVPPDPQPPIPATPPPTPPKLDTDVHHVGVRCQSRATQLCAPVQGYTVVTKGILRITFTASPACSKIKVHASLGGREYWVSRPLAAGETATFDFDRLPPRSYALGLQAEGVAGGCNHGSLYTWGGTLTVTRSV